MWFHEAQGLCLVTYCSRYKINVPRFLVKKSRDNCSNDLGSESHSTVQFPLYYLSSGVKNQKKISNFQLQK